MIRVTAVIPCFNEEKHIAEVITETQRYVDRVIVVNNMSTDRTGEIAHDLLFELGAGNDCRMCYGKGAGASTALGIGYALNSLGWLYSDIIVTLDGDGQHNPEGIPNLVQPILDGEADVVIGSRFLGDYQIQRYRKFGIDTITWLYNIGSGQKITDGQSCFRAFTRDVAENIRIMESGFGFSTEFLIKARAKGYRIKEVPISCIYHDKFSENSSINPIKHGLGVALKTLKWRIKEKRLD